MADIATTMGAPQTVWHSCNNKRQKIPDVGSLWSIRRAKGNELNKLNSATDYKYYGLPKNIVCNFSFKNRQKKYENC